MGSFIALTIILILVLLMPFTIKIVERNLEVFLFMMGIAAVIVSRVLTVDLLINALKNPLNITFAVILAGFIFRWFQQPIEKSVTRMSKSMPIRLFLAIVVILLGLISSIITAIIAAIVLVSIVSVLNLDRKSEIRLVILACYAIGLGAVLTPVGEPLSTITTSKLNGDFFYLLNLIGIEVITGVFIFGVLTGILINPKIQTHKISPTHKSESTRDIIFRGFKIYLFIMALTLLGAGFEPFIERYLLHLSPFLLYWINMISAVLDNATLAAAEISPDMNESAIKALLLGLLVSGGMLIPGNIPNIIAAGKLNITSAEWARYAIPLGLVAMIAYFIVILVESVS